jgi:ABC-type phosphate transport system substrate-binding protein
MTGYEELDAHGDWIADGSYGFSRSLYIYVSTTAMAENPAVASFVDVYLSADGIAQVAEAGYVNLPEDRQAAAMTAWEAAKA